MKIQLFLHSVVVVITRPICIHVDAFSLQTAALRVRETVELKTQYKYRFALPSRGDSDDSMETDTTAPDPEKDNDNSSIRSRLRSRIKGLVVSIRTLPIVPSGLSLLVGFQLGRKVTQWSATRTAATVTTAAAAAAVTTTASRTIAAQARQWPLVSVLLLSFAVKELWVATPTWIKRSIFNHGRRRRRDDNNDNDKNEPRQQKFTSTTATTDAVTFENDDLTSLTALGAKLQSLSALASDKLKLAQDERSDLKLAFLVLLQLVTQIKARSAQVRDANYQLDGIPILGIRRRRKRNDNGTEDVMDDDDDDDDDDTSAAMNVMKDLRELFEFADWAYDELPKEQSLEGALAEVGFSLLRHDKTDLPGYVSHYVAISKERKSALIGVKGTSNLGDLLTDCCGLPISYDLTGPYVREGNLTIRCHEGILISAQRLFAKLELLVEELLLPTGYTIIVTGHSLGAGVAALVGLLLRCRFPTLLDDHDGTLLRVVAFASPPILDCDAALACEPFVTTIVNNADIIPRASLSNLVVLMEFLKVLDDKLEDAGLKPKDLLGVSQFMLNLTKTDSEMVMSLDEIVQGLNQAFDKVGLRDPDHLYVPGKVIHMYDMWSKENYGQVNDPSVKDFNNSNEACTIVRTAERAQMTNGTSRALRTIELDSRFLSDHLSPAYRSSIRSLLDLVDSPSAQESSVATP